MISSIISDISSELRVFVLLAKIRWNERFLVGSVGFLKIETGSREKMRSFC